MANEQQTSSLTGSATAPKTTAHRIAGALRSLRIRAFLVVVAVVLTPLLVVGLSTYFERGMGGVMLSQVRAGADETVALLEQPPDASVESANIEKQIDVIAHHHRVRIRVLDLDGTVLVDANREAQGDLWKTVSNIWYGRDGMPSLKSYDKTLGPVSSRTEFAEARARGHSADCRTTAGGEQLVCHAVAYLDATNGVGPRIIYVQDSAPRAITALRDQSRQLTVLTLAILPLGIALGWWLGWRFVKPIEQMRSQLIAKAATAAPGADVDVGGRQDEFGDLTNAFNLLLKALDERRRSNEAFVADLAHEFKNPVAAIRAAADALGPGAVDETRAARLQTALKDSSRRLDSLLTQFLELARAEAGMPREPRSVVDLDPLVEGVVAGFTADERFKSIRFVVERSDARVLGVPERLEAAIRNLVDNAASFARSEVKVTGAVDRKSVTMRVQDDGPGIPPEDLPKVFDRFFTSRRHLRGTGLGLALVRAVVEAHGGAVLARSVPGQGATFEIRLPRTDAPAETSPLRATG